MAKRSTANSRANTASPAKKQSSTAPVANARSTRAQSRELSEPLPTPRKRRARADSVDDDTSQRSSRRARTVPRDVALAERLGAVEEEASQSNGSIESDNDGDEIHARPSLNQTRESSVAESTVSEEEARGIDPTTVPRILGLLDSAVMNLVPLLLAADQDARHQNWDAVQTPDTRECKLVLREFKLFNLQKEDLTSQAFIRPSMLHRAVLGQHYDDSRAFPGLDAIVQRANLIKLVFDMILEPDNDKTADSLQAIENTIQDVIGGDGVDNDLAEIGFVLSVQALIAKLSNADKTPPTEVFEGYFPREQGLSPSEAYLRRFVADWQNAENLPELQEVRENIERIHAVFNKFKGKRHQLITSLEEEFVSDANVVKLVEFATERAAQLSRIIASSGGTQGIIEELERVIANPALSEEPDEPSPEPAPIEDKLPQVATKSAISALRRRQRRLQSNSEQHDQQPAPTANMVAPSSAHRSSGRSRGPEASIDPSLIQSHGTNPSEEQSGLMFNDDEVEADEVEEDQDDAQYQDILPTQDTGFQADRRDTTLADQRRQSKRAAEPAQQSRVQQEQPHANGNPVPVRNRRAFMTVDDDSVDPEQQPAPTNGPADLSGETQVPTSTSIRQELEKAKSRSARSRLISKKGSRERHTWSAEEEERLNDLITLDEEFETQLSYSDMLEQDRTNKIFKDDTDDIFPEANVFHAARKAEDLRFKARNIKTKMWRVGKVLPPRWNQVALATAQKEEIKSYGKDYDTLLREEEELANKAAIEVANRLAIKAANKTARKP